MGSGRWHFTPDRLEFALHCLTTAVGNIVRGYYALRSDDWPPQDRLEAREKPAPIQQEVENQQ